MTLLEAYQNKIYTIIRVSGDELLHRHLIDMGFTSGTEIFVYCVAPFGRTVLVCLRGSIIALRDDAASLINIKPV